MHIITNTYVSHCLNLKLRRKLCRKHCQSSSKNNSRHSGDSWRRSSEPAVLSAFSCDVAGPCLLLPGKVLPEWLQRRVFESQGSQLRRVACVEGVIEPLRRFMEIPNFTSVAGELVWNGNVIRKLLRDVHECLIRLLRLLQRAKRGRQIEPAECSSWSAIGQVFGYFQATFPAVGLGIDLPANFHYVRMLCKGRADLVQLRPGFKMI